MRTQWVPEGVLSLFLKFRKVLFEVIRIPAFALQAVVTFVNCKAVIIATTRNVYLSMQMLVLLSLVKLVFVSNKCRHAERPNALNEVAVSSTATSFILSQSAVLPTQKFIPIVKTRGLLFANAR